MSKSNATNAHIPEPIAVDPCDLTDQCGPLVRREFWTAFKWYMEANSSVNCARVSTDGWIWHNCDLTMGNMLSFVRARQGDVGVKYTLNDAQAETVYAFIRRHADQVEDAFDHSLLWRRGSAAGSGIIEVRRRITSFDKQTWPSLFVWFQRQLETFRVALLPLVGRIPPKCEMNSWTEQRFLRELETWNPSCLRPVQRLLSWATTPGARPVWGRGYTASFALTVSMTGIPYQLMNLRADGTFSLLFTQLKRTPMFEDRASRLAVLARFNRLPGIHLSDKVVDSRPSLPLAMLADPGVYDALTEVLDWFKQSVRTGQLS